MDDGGFNRRETRYIGHLCERCGEMPCICGTPEFEAWVEESIKQLDTAIADDNEL